MERVECIHNTLSCSPEAFSLVHGHHWWHHDDIMTKTYKNGGWQPFQTVLGRPLYRGHLIFTCKFPFVLTYWLVRSLILKGFWSISVFPASVCISSVWVTVPLCFRPRSQPPKVSSPSAELGFYFFLQDIFELFVYRFFLMFVSLVWYLNGHWSPNPLRRSMSTSFGRLETGIISPCSSLNIYFKFSEIVFKDLSCEHQHVCLYTAF